MFYRSLFVSVVVASSVAPVATAAEREDGRGQSIMFDQDRRYLTEMPQQSDGRWERCRKLRKEVEALKGKPQRRFAAAQRYEAECKAPRE